MGGEAREVEVIGPESGLEIRNDAPLAERSVEDVLAQVEKIQRLMSSVLRKDEHYGVIPGTGTPERPAKPTLLQPGAQKLCFTFRLIPSFDVRRHDLPGGHREYEVICTLINEVTGKQAGQGVGLCSTMESKYRWRRAERVCPECNEETIKRSKFADDGGEKGWYCYAKIGGCNAKFGANDERIVSQEVGRKENPDIADTYNTVLKIAKKRGFVDASLTATAASDIFAQDLEDLVSTQETAKTSEPTEKQDPPKQSQKAGKRGSGNSQTKKGAKSPAAQVWDKCLERQQEIGFSAMDIANDVLKALGRAKSADITKGDVPIALDFIQRFDPPEQRKESPQDHSEGDKALF